MRTERKNRSYVAVSDKTENSGKTTRTRKRA